MAGAGGATRRGVAGRDANQPLTASRLSIPTCMISSAALSMTCGPGSAPVTSTAMPAGMITRPVSGMPIRLATTPHGATVPK